MADFITKLPLAQEYDIILVVCNCFSKMVHFIATIEKTSAEGLAKLFEIMYGSCMDFQKASYQIEEYSLWRE